MVECSAPAATLAMILEHDEITSLFKSMLAYLALIYTRCNCQLLLQEAKQIMYLNSTWRKGSGPNCCSMMLNLASLAHAWRAITAAAHAHHFGEAAKQAHATCRQQDENGVHACACICNIKHVATSASQRTGWHLRSVLVSPGHSAKHARTVNHCCHAAS